MLYYKINIFRTVIIIVVMKFVNEVVSKKSALSVFIENYNDNPSLPPPPHQTSLVAPVKLNVSVISSIKIISL